MKRKWLTGIVLVSFIGMVLFGTTGSAFAQRSNPSPSTGWRCGNLFVQEGVDSAQVLYNCGEPFSKDKSYIDHYGEVDKWIYGPEAGYFYILYFFVGKMVAIESIRQE